MPIVTIRGYGYDTQRAKNARNYKILIRRVHERLERLWRDATQVFLQATAEAMAVDTGMSVASLRPLAAKVYYRKALVQTFSGFGPKYNGYDYEGKANGNDLGARHDGAKGHKSMRRGEIMGGKAYKLSFGTPDKLIMVLEFEAVVYQHLFHESHWDSLDKGEAAMLKFLNEKFNTGDYEIKTLIFEWFGGVIS